MGVNVRAKGQRGEREAADLLTSWGNEVTLALGVAPVELKRNLQQTQNGGYDLVGIDWLALEVKRQENVQVNQWWKQTLRQAKPGQIPFLMYRPSRQPWRFRFVLTAYFAVPEAPVVSSIYVEADEINAKAWFQMELWRRLKLGVVTPVV